METFTNNPVIQTQKNSTLTDKYQFISSEKISETLVKNDFQLIKTSVTRTKDEARRGFQKHFLEFQHPKFNELKEKVKVDSFPRILLVNSHDGTSALQLRLALFRLVCSNGLVISRGDFGAFSIRHSANALPKLEDALVAIQNQAAELADRVGVLSAKQVTRESVINFADQVLELRLGEDYKKLDANEKDLARDLLTSFRRGADAGADAWRIFNRVQENFIRGGWAFNSQALGMRRARAINSAASSFEKNKKLWELAEKSIFA